ncbi:MAG TPA: hypothetical protein VLE20_01860 [Blastocatellia bacterium]|jgi:hypothetical protein|nr:hypothetical protein [Blastocatellia bacterium]
MRNKEHSINRPGLAQNVDLRAREDKTLVTKAFTRRNTAGASTAPGVLKHMPTGSGSAGQRSGKGGKSGGGMGGQQAGGIKGGGKRKTHFGSK